MNKSMKDFCKKNPRISTRDEVERSEVKSSHHHLITRDEVERNEVNSSVHQLTNSNSSPHQLITSPPETKSNGTKLNKQIITLKDHLMKKYHIYGFEKLEVYKLALSLSIEIRRLVKSFPK